MGRWRRDTEQVVNDGLFWIIIQISHLSHKPLDHMLHFLQSATPSSNNHCSQLVCGKALSILRSWSVQLNAFSWQCLLVALKKSATDDEFYVMALTLHLHMHCAASFNRRVIVPLSQCAPWHSMCVSNVLGLLINKHPMLVVIARPYKQHCWGWCQKLLSIPHSTWWIKRKHTNMRQTKHTNNIQTM